MARSFNGSSNFGSANVGGFLSGFNKLTIAFWLWQNAFDNTDELAMEYSTNANSNNGSFFIDPNSSSFPGLVEIDYDQIGATNINVKTFARPSAAAWHHWAVLIDASLTHHQITHVYIDGVDQSLTERTDTTNAATNFGNYTLYFMSRAGASLFNAGRMADITLYMGLLLPAAEVSALANGARPNQVENGSAGAWWPLDGNQSPEPDYSSHAQNMTLGGTAFVAGPPMGMFTPRWPQSVFAPGTDTFANNPALVMM